MSEAGLIKDKHYQFLLKYFPGNIMYMRFKALWADTVQVVESYGLEKKLRIQERLDVFIRLLFYNLKYRTYTQQSLELMIEAFLCGCNCTRIVHKK